MVKVQIFRYRYFEFKKSLVIVSYFIISTVMTEHICQLLNEVFEKSYTCTDIHCTAAVHCAVCAMLAVQIVSSVQMYAVQCMPIWHHFKSTKLTEFCSPCRNLHTRMLFFLGAQRMSATHSLGS